MQETSIKKLEEKALSIPELVKTIVVKDSETLNRANRALLYIKNLRSQINEVFDPIIKKAHEAHKEALSQKKKTEQPLIEAEQYIKPQISYYWAEIERQRKEAERKERERKEAEEALGGEEVSTPIIPKEKPKLKGVSIKKIWKFRIVNISIIPPEYWTLDTQKIGKEVRESYGKIKIPGIEAYQEDIVSARSNI